MADNAYVTSSPHLAQISRDEHVPENPIPLSPQWLLPKPGENKTGTVYGENHASPFSAFANRPGIVKSGNSDQTHDIHKKKDVFRPSIIENRERWRDEERETKSSARKDSWREEDKEPLENRKVDRWTDNPSGRYHGQTQRAPSERLADSGNKDANHDPRRESKWSSRWGPDGKETDSVHDKWTGSGMDEWDTDHPRPWRSSSALSRGKIEQSSYQSPTSNKLYPMGVHGRGRDENYHPTFSLGGGRGTIEGNPMNNFNTSIDSHPVASFSAKGDRYYYSRSKLLDVYRVTDMRSSERVFDGAMAVPSLTQEEPLEPLALIEPTPEELFILKGIDKGEILSSGAPQVSKDGPVGRNMVDGQPRRTLSGSKEDLPRSADNNKDEIADGFKETEHGAYAINNDVGNIREPRSHGTSDNPGPTWWSNFQKDTTKEFSGNPVNSSYSAPKWQVGNEPVIRRQQSGHLDREQEPRMLPQPFPEDMVLFYKDPQGAIQGPFTGSDIIGWFEAGYFGIDLLVRLANTPPDSPYRLLGDIMPHLRAKVRPPPGFNAAKQSEVDDESVRSNVASFSAVHSGLVDNNNNKYLMKHDPQNQHESTKEAENRFIESLMSNNMGGSPFENFGLSEGMQGYFGKSNLVPSSGTENGDNLYQLAKRIELEKQRSLSNSYSLWPGRDAPSVAHKPDIFQDSTGRDAPTSAVNSGATNWSNFPGQGGLDPLQTSFGINQRLQPQAQPTLANVHSQGFNNRPGPLIPEKFLASGLSQEPQLLTLLQQQYMTQSTPQASIPTQQLSMLDEYLLLKQQQQKQELQQQQLLQQQLLSRVLTERRSHQHLAKQSFEQMQTLGLPVESSLIKRPGFQPAHEMFHTGPDIQASGVHNTRATDFVNTPPALSQADYSFESETLLHLPHQLMESNASPEDSDAIRVERSNENDLQETIFQAGLRNNKSISISTYDDPLMSVPADKFEIPSVPSLRDPHKFSPENLVNFKVSSVDVAEVPQALNKSANELFAPKEMKAAEACEVKRNSEKNSTKQKSSKTASKTQQAKQPDFEVNKVTDTEFCMQRVQHDTEYGTHPKEVGEANSDVIEVDSDIVPDEASQIYERKNDVEPSATIQQHNTQAHTGQRAWKPAHGFNPKSFLEIQQEEQWRAQTQAQLQVMTAADLATSIGSMNVSTPWAGTVGNSHRVSSEPSIIDISMNQKRTKSQLHEILAGENTGKPTERESASSESTAHVSVLSVTGSQSNSVEGGDFINAKRSKKSRRKAAKAKVEAEAVKVSAPVAAAELPISSSPNEKEKSSRQALQERDLPSGPSLGDFVVRKGENAAASPAPVWSTDSGKLAKQTSLRDILKEQEKKVSSAQLQTPVSIPQKSVSARSTRGNGPLWSSTMPSSAKAAPPTFLGSFQSKSKVDDDLFWGSVHHPKQQSDFPQLAKQSSLAKKTTVKGVSGGGRSAETSFSSSPALKGKKDVSTKRSEAMDFRDWCQSECVRLIGTKDTSFLEFCLKQSRSEAEILLKENLSSYDRDHAFIDKFLNYKDFLPSDVLEMAFQSQDSHTLSGDTNRVHDGARDPGKKKGKKGKKISSAVLGFNVVSNRIMGEIQTIDD